METKKNQIKELNKQNAEFEKKFNRDLKAIFSRANIDHIKFDKISDGGFNIFHEDTTRNDWYAIDFTYRRGSVLGPSEMKVNNACFGSFNPNEDKNLANYFILQGQIASKPEIFNELKDLFDIRSEFSTEMLLKYHELEKQNN